MTKSATYASAGVDIEAANRATEKIKEVARAGFVLVNQYDFVKPDNVDYFLVFRPSDSGP